MVCEINLHIIKTEVKTDLICSCDSKINRPTCKDRVLAYKLFLIKEPSYVMCTEVKR